MYDIDDLKITIDGCLKRWRNEKELRHTIKKIKKSGETVGGGRINLLQDLFHLPIPNSQLWILIDVLLTIMEYNNGITYLA